MRQQVNLYQPIFRKPQRVFSALAMVQSLLIVALGLAAIYGYGTWQVRVLEGQVAALERERERATARLVELQRELPVRQPSQVLANEIDRLGKGLGARRELLAVLSAQVEGGAGFAALLEALARRRVEGLWLTGLRIAAGGGALELAGRATTPTLIPRLVQALGAEQAFRGRKFRALTIERPETAPEIVEFVLRTEARAEDGGG